MEAKVGRREPNARVGYLLSSRSEYEEILQV